MSTHEYNDRDERQAAEQLAARIDSGPLEPRDGDPAELRSLLRTYREAQALLAAPDPRFERRLRHTLTLDDERWAGVRTSQTALTAARPARAQPRPRRRWWALGGLGTSVITVVLLFSFLMMQNQNDAAMNMMRPSPTTGAPGRAPNAQGQPQLRMVVQQVSMSLVMPDTAAGLERVKAIVAEQQGYIQELEAAQSAGGSGRISLSLRVPAATLEQTLERLRGLASYVSSERMSSDDQTDTYVDIQARMKNLELTEAELQKLLSGAQQRDDRVADILSISKELSGVREQIEQLQAQKQLIEQSVALTRVDLQLHPETNAPAPAPGFSPGAIVTEAWESLLEVLEWLATVGLWLLVYLPLILLLLGTILLARRLMRRRRVEE